MIFVFISQKKTHFKTSFESAKKPEWQTPTGFRKSFSYAQVFNM